MLWRKESSGGPILKRNAQNEQRDPGPHSEDITLEQSVRVSMAQFQMIALHIFARTKP